MSLFVVNMVDTASCTYLPSTWWKRLLATACKDCTGLKTRLPLTLIGQSSVGKLINMTIFKIFSCTISEFLQGSYITDICFSLSRDKTAASTQRAIMMALATYRPVAPPCFEFLYDRHILDPSSYVLRLRRPCFAVLSSVFSLWLSGSRGADKASVPVCRHDGAFSGLRHQTSEKDSYMLDTS